MTRQTYTLNDNSDAPTITLGICNGDLTLTGEDGRTDIAAHSDKPLDAVVRDSGHLVIEWCGDLHLAVPRGTTVIAERVEGDARIEGVAGVKIASIDGDLRLRAVAGTAAIGHVKGDAAAMECAVLSVHDVGGDLRIEHNSLSAEAGRVGGDVRAVDVARLTLGAVGGDARLEKIAGTLQFVEIEGDLSLQGVVASFGPAHVGGDAALDLAYTPGAAHHLDVEGDASVVVARDADLTLHATVRGDITGVPAAHADGSVTRRWGEGTAHLTLRVGGDLSVRSGATASHPTFDAPVAPAAPTMPLMPVAPTAPLAPIARATPMARALSAMGDAEDGALAAVLDAVARGSLSPAEADDLLSRSRT